MCRAKIAKISVGLVLAIPLLGLAVEPTTQPATAVGTGATSADLDVPDGTAPPPPYRGGDRSEPAAAGRARPGLRNSPAVSSKEIDEAMLFMSQHSSNRYKAIQSLPDGEKKNGVQNYAARAYMNWMRVFKEDPELYKVILKRIGLEDDIFGAIAQLKATPPDGQQAAKSAIRNQVAKLVDVGLEERTLRLDRLTRTIKAEKQKLDTDTANREELVTERMQTILTDDKGLVPAGNESSNIPTGGKGGRGRGDRGR